MAPARRNLEAWLWTGPVGHLLGGALDLAAALARHGVMPRLRRLARRLRAGRRRPAAHRER